MPCYMDSGEALEGLVESSARAAGLAVEPDALDWIVERVGGDRPMRVDVRVVVATHRNLEEQVQAGAFRQDLYHRIFVFPILLPPLRERAGDLPVLVRHFARQVSEQNGWKPKEFTAEAVKALENYAWPGNVRELRNSAERLLLLADREVDIETVRLVLPTSRATVVT